MESGGLGGTSWSFAQLGLGGAGLRPPSPGWLYVGLRFELGVGGDFVQGDGVPPNT